MKKERGAVVEWSNGGGKKSGQSSPRGEIVNPKEKGTSRRKVKNLSETSGKERKREMGWGPVNSAKGKVYSLRGVAQGQMGRKGKKETHRRSNKKGVGGRGQKKKEKPSVLESKAWQETAMCYWKACIGGEWGRGRREKSGTGGWGLVVTWVTERRSPNNLT